MNTSLAETRHIRPAARHILTIGAGIIKDNYTAILELVKNAYDADATEVDIDFKKKEEEVIISVQDNGHGMSRDVVINSWLVPSTDNKVKREKSPNGRKMQGKKGIGRYAVIILGNDFSMETIDKDTLEKTVIVIDWNEFKNPKYTYLDEVPILVETTIDGKQSGTKLQVTSKNDWEEADLKQLVHELKKHLSPISIKSDYSIKLNLSNFELKEKMYFENNKDIKPYPITFSYHYKISGYVKTENQKTIAQIEYQNAYIKDSLPDVFKIDISFEKGIPCGEINFDIKVFDKDDIGFKFLYEQRTDLTEKEIRDIIDDIAGIGIYKDDFGIRPYGEKEYDWLGLNKRRVNNPTMRLSANQVFGIIDIQDEKISGLEENDQRIGLKENKQYEGLKEIIITLLNEIEIRRYSYREAKGKGSSSKDTSVQIKEVVSMTNLTTNVTRTLKESNVSAEVIDKVSKEIANQQIEKEKKATLIIEKQQEKQKQTIYTYQVQATLGKVAGIMFHEGSKYLTPVKNQSRNISEWAEELKEKLHLKIEEIAILDLLNKIIDRSKMLNENAELFVKLFGKIRPFITINRPNKKVFNLQKVVRQSFDIFEAELKEKKIDIIINISDKINILGWDIDLLSAFTNLIENSIYWIAFARKQQQQIKVEAEETQDEIIIDYFDTGIGIEEKFLNQIFELNFTTKKNGTGLGLAIAGDAIQRNDGNLYALTHEGGAHFQIKLLKTK